MPSNDPYQTLGISHAATMAEAREAYLKRVRVLHPDRFDPVSQATEWTQANQMLREVNAAWEMIQARKTPLNGGSPVYAPTDHSGHSASRAASPSRSRPRRSRTVSRRTAALVGAGFILVGLIGLVGFIVEESSSPSPVAPTPTMPAFVAQPPVITGTINAATTVTQKGRTDGAASVPLAAGTRVTVQHTNADGTLTVITPTHLVGDVPASAVKLDETHSP